MNSDGTTGQQAQQEFVAELRHRREAGGYSQKALAAAVVGLGRSKHSMLLGAVGHDAPRPAMLMLSDREKISRGLAEGPQYGEIPLRLGSR